MKPVNRILENAQEMENIVSVCCGNPRGDELPQAAGLQDILMDVYSDILNVPRDYAAGHFNHQYADDYEYDGIIH